MVNYSDAKIYKVLNTVDDEVYVGSTTQSLSKRMGKHRRNATQRNTQLYQHMNNIGINNFYIELIETYPCNNTDELHKREGEWIRQMGTLNQIVSGRTAQQYRADNKDKLREQNLQYRKQNNIICTCVCGSLVHKLNMCKHIKTEKHKQFIEAMKMTTLEHEPDTSTTAPDSGSEISCFDLSSMD